MRTSLLVLVRWQGEIIAAHTVEQGGSVQKLPFLDGFASDDVRAEVYDVTPERAALGRLTPKVDLRTVYGLMVSGGLHLGLALVALLTVMVQSHSPQKLEADDANRKAATTEDVVLRVSADEGAKAGAVEPPKEEKPAAEPEPVLAAVEENEPEPDDPNAAAEASQRSEPALVLGVPTEEKGSETPGSKGSDPETASPSTCAPSRAPKNTGKICRRTVVVTALDVPPSCFTDTVMQLGQTGTLTFPCEGDGEAKLTFGKKSFRGASLGGKLDMCAGTEYPFSDGCRWASAQRVSGRIAATALSFNYGEAPKPGQNRHCAAACSASGTVTVK